MVGGIEGVWNILEPDSRADLIRSQLNNSFKIHSMLCCVQQLNALPKRGLVHSRIISTSSRASLPMSLAAAFLDWDK